MVCDTAIVLNSSILILPHLSWFISLTVKQFQHEGGKCVGSTLESYNLLSKGIFQENWGVFEPSHEGNTRAFLAMPQVTRLNLLV